MTMTNNPTIDGVSRELRVLLERIVQGGNILDSSEAMDELRTLLNAPVVEPTNDLREHCKQCAEVVKTWPEWKQNCLGGAPVVERQPAPFYVTEDGKMYAKAEELLASPTVQRQLSEFSKLRTSEDKHADSSEVAALKSTIAQLQAEQQLLQSTVARYLDRIAELESGRGEPVAWLAEAVGPDGTSYRRTSSITQITMRDVEYAWGKGVVSKYEINIQPLFAAQQAPVAVVLPPFAEKVISKLRRCEECFSDFESGGVDIGRHWLDLLTQLGLLNRVQRSPALWEITQQGEDCLDATAALNGERK